jgi:hypothetical protein
MGIGRCTPRNTHQYEKKKNKEQKKIKLNTLAKKAKGRKKTEKRNGKKAKKQNQRRIDVRSGSVRSAVYGASM